jgi:hypothetical protein
LRSCPAFVLFHLRVGVRVSLRVIGPLLAGFLFCFYVLRYDFFYRLAEILYIESAPEAALVVFFLVGLLVGRIAAPRVLAGVRGWIRHLPASTRLHRTLADLSIFLAQTPVLAVCLFFGRAVLKPLSSADEVRLAAVALAFFAASWTVAASNPALRPRRKSGPRFRRSYQGFAFQAALFLRPIKRSLAACYGLALLSMGAASILLYNNALKTDLELKIGVFGAVLAVGLFLGDLGRRTTLNRPPWVWARSLPMSSASRILTDAAMAAALALPLLAVSARLGRWVWIWTAAALPWLAVRAASSLRTGAAKSWSVRARIGLEALMTALALALEPRASLVLLAASPLAVLAAAAKDRGQKVSLWSELHQLADSDALSGSPS